MTLSVARPERRVLTWLHFGDLHLTGPGEQNHRDFRQLIGVANTHLAGAVDFAVLPGDNADDGTPAQFRLVRDALDELRMPVHILAGDHDFKPGNLDAFHAVLGAERLPRAFVVGGTCCIFLDIVSPGGGGPDFRLGAPQLEWLRRTLAEADAAGQDSVVFMHAFPTDLRGDGEEVTALFARHRVVCIDTGHTHYNELAVTGGAIHAATRSTGQVEEGGPGFSVATVDPLGGGRAVVSWQFQTLDAPWPLVMITSPADRRLVFDPTHIIRGPFTLRARVWGGGEAEARIGEGAWRPMQPPAAAAPCWTLECDAPADGVAPIRVRATGQTDEIELRVDRAGSFHAGAPASFDDAAIGAWPSRHLLGTRLGPNRNGRHW